MEGAAEAAGVGATFRVLLTRPGQLTEEAIAGIGSERPRPLFLFLICAVAYFLSVPIVNRLTTAAPAASPAFSAVGTVDQVVSIMEAQADESPTIALVYRRLGRDRLRRLIADPSPLDDALANSFTLGMFVLMPFFALLTWAAWRSAATKFSPHFWFASHLHAAWFAALIAAQVASVAGSTVVNVVVGAAVLIYSTWYATVAMRRVLGGSKAEFFLRSTLVGLAYVVAMFVVVWQLMLVAMMRL